MKIGKQLTRGRTWHPGNAGIKRPWYAFFVFDLPDAREVLEYMVLGKGYKIKG